MTGEFTRIIYAASWNLFTLTAEAKRVFCQLVMFSTVFPLDVQNEILPLSRVLCYSWLVCLLGFWLRNEKVFVFHLAWWVLKRVQKSESILALLDSLKALLDSFLYLCLFVCLFFLCIYKFHEVERSLCGQVYARL